MTDPGRVYPVSFIKKKVKMATKPSRATAYQNCTVHNVRSAIKPEKVGPIVVLW
jgi:hypothetical protein